MSPRDRSRLGLAALMVGAGVLHFVVPGAYERIVPRWLGHPRAWVYGSGLVEMASGALLAVPRSRRAGAALAAATIVAVYPANVQMAIDAGVPHDLAGWAAWLRLPLQIPLFRWAMKHARRPAPPPLSGSAACSTGAAAPGTTRSR